MTVETAGTGGTQDGLAALLLGLATWLAALGAFLVLPAVWWLPDRSWWWSPLLAFAAASAVAAGAALLASGVVHVLTGVDVANVPALVAASCLGAMTFVAIVQALVTRFGSRGWLVGLLLLVVQAAAAGLPYPVTSMPGPIAALHPILPMTYAVDGSIGPSPGPPRESVVVSMRWSSWAGW